MLDVQKFTNLIRGIATDILLGLSGTSRNPSPRGAGFDRGVKDGPSPCAIIIAPCKCLCSPWARR